MKPLVVIHTNDQQLIPALVSAHSLKSRSKTPELFDVRVLRLEETPQLYKRNGQKFVWWDGSRPSVWRRRDLQSFAALRRMVPALLGFTGRALVIDPDVFAVGDVYELLSRKMNGKAILCRHKAEWRSGRQLYSSAVMLLDCQKLTRWDWDRDIEQVFSCQLALGPWLSLLDVSPDEIGLFEDEWNHHDTLTNRTKLLHNTEILTQPWKTGLRASRYTYAPQILLSREWFRARASRMLKRDPTRTFVYQRHPDPRQERMFFMLLKECLAQGGVTERSVRLAMRRHWLRKDALAVLETIPSPSGPDEVAR